MAKVIIWGDMIGVGLGIHDAVNVAEITIRDKTNGDAAILTLSPEALRSLAEVLTRYANTVDDIVTIRDL